MRITELPAGSLQSTDYLAVDDATLGTRKLAMAKVVSYDAQSPTTAEQAQARANIGVGSASTSAAGLVQLYDGINSTSTTMAATPAAVKAAYEHGGTGRNLLDNWYFLNPVNQREQSSYSTTDKYTIDRWKLTSGSVTVGSSGITLNGTIVQILEKSIGLPVVCSALLSDGTMITPTYDDSTKTFTLTASNQTIVAVKLEVGSSQTLAVEDNSSWQLTEVPNFYEQLTRCQFFFYRMKTGNANEGLVTCPAWSTSNATGFFSFPVMRATPTVTMNNVFELRGNVTKTVTALSVNYVPYRWFVTLDFTASGITSGNFYTFSSSTAGASIDFSADL